MSAKKIMLPKTRLAELLNRPGGISRDEAVSEAVRAVEALRDDCVGAIEQTIANIERTVSQQEGGKLSAENMQNVLAQADRIVTLAGTYGYSQLDMVARGLCDVIAGLTRIGSRAAEPVAVHVKALRLLAPRAEPLPSEESTRMLAELGKVVAHFRAAAQPAVAAAK